MLPFPSSDFIVPSQCVANIAFFHTKRKYANDSHPRGCPALPRLRAGHKSHSPRLLLAGIALAMVPDMDVLSFKLGVAYGNAFGHRGFTHSLLFAFVVPILCVLIGRRWLKASLTRCWLFLTVSLLSHSLLDSITTGGKGVGWLWPWSDERFFAPWQVIKVAPFALSRYATPYGHQVILSELLWVWLPGLMLMGMLWWKRR